MPRASVGIVFCGFAGLAHAAPSRAPADTLPLERVRLYETGVGYFERSGVLAPSARLPVPASHLDDALKTLVVLGGSSDASISGVHFDSVTTTQLGRALAKLPIETAEAPTYRALLRSLTGRPVSLRARSRVWSGRVLGVVPAESSGIETCARSETAPQPTTDPKAEACRLTKQAGVLFASDDGGMMQFAEREIESVAPRDDAVKRRLDQGLASSTASDTQRSLDARGTGTGKVTLGYVAEAPIWRTTYRLVLAPENATLQAWALVHNDTEERWRDVKLELVNGKPDSFLFPLAAPRYAERRLVTPEHALSSVPQLLHRGADEMWSRGEGIGLGSISTIGYGSGGLGLSGIGEGGGGRGEGALSESSLLAVGDLTRHTTAVGTEVGALFHYSLPSTVTLEAHTSALVPLLHEPIAVERVTLFADADAPASSALVVTNSSRQTLPPGTVAIFEGGGFGGETAIDRMRPREQRRVTFGVDLDVELKKAARSTSQTTQRLRFGHGRLVEHYVESTTFDVSLTNRSGSPRTVHVAMDVVNNSKILGADGVYVDPTTEQASAIFRLNAESAQQFAVEVKQGLQRQHRWLSLGSQTLVTLMQSKEVPIEQQRILAIAAKHLVAHERVLARGVALERKLAAETRRMTRLTRTLALIAKADADKGEEMAAEIFAIQKRITRLEAARSGLQPHPPFAAAKRALMGLNST